MKRFKIIFLIFVFAIFKGIAQEPRVLLSEKKQGKRTQLFAENTTKDTLTVFLLLFPEGYRRSASKPVLTAILPKEKIYMTTLIAMADVPTSYTYELIIEDKQQDITLNFEADVEDIEKVIAGRIVLFSQEDCERCTLLHHVLTEKKIVHRNFDLTKDERLYKQFLQFIERKYPNKQIYRLPVIWNRDNVIFGYDDIEVILNEIEE